MISTLLLGVARMRSTYPCAVALVLAACLVPAEARATPQLFLAVAEPPYNWSGGCVLCHTDNGTAGSATRPFARTLKAMGISSGSSTDELRRVLEQLGDVDTDHDELSDVEELILGSDPNEPGTTVVEGVEHRYGCIPASVAGYKPNEPGAAILLLGLVVLRHRRCRRHVRQCRRFMEID